MAEVACPQCGNPCEETHKFCPVCGFPVSEISKKPKDDPLLGATLPGGYVILELVGVGGMGRVYRAEQKALGRTVAVKIIHPHLLGDESASVRFITEARAASRLNHPNSVAVIDFGKNGSQLYLVMELLRGKDLARLIYEEGLPSIKRTIDILIQVLAALGEAHHLGIIHRDLKPENIVLEPTRTGGDIVKVVDFGLAKMKAEVQSPGITNPGIVCGTPDYMAPEQGRGDVIDHRSDLYACGVILFQTLTGRLPFEAESPTQVVLMHLSLPPPDPRTIAPEREIPDVLAEVTLHALQKDANRRYQTSEEFTVALRAALASIESAAARQSMADLGILCPSCGAMIPRGQRFCGDCGARVSTPMDSPRPTNPAPSSRAAVSQSQRGITSVPRLPIPFTGREDDLAWLETHRRAAHSSVVAVRIVGEHGVGKTRLLHEFVRGAAAAGDLIVHASPDPWWAEVGTFALRRAIVDLAGLPLNGGSTNDWTGATPEARRGLADLFTRGTTGRETRSPFWARATHGSLSPEDRRIIAAEALRWAITRAQVSASSAGGPMSRRRLNADGPMSSRGAQPNNGGASAHRRLILALDDLHAMDGASRAAFADVISEPPLAAMLVVATHVPGFDPVWREAGVLHDGSYDGGASHPPHGAHGPTSGNAGHAPSAGNGTNHRASDPVGGARGSREDGGSLRSRSVRGLPTPVAAALVKGTVPGAGSAERSALTVPPLYVDQLVRFNLEGGVDPPPRMGDLLALRIERLPIEARRILQAIAVIGDAADLEAIHCLVPELRNVDPLLEVLAHAGFIEHREGMIATTHTLVREVTLATIPAGVRRDLHAKAPFDVHGDALPLPLEVQALHAYHAQNAFEALMLLEQVADRAASRGDQMGCVLALRRGLDLARREMFRGEIDDPIQAVLIFSRKLGEALSRAGQLTDADGVLREALDLAGPSGRDRAMVLGSLAFVARERDRASEARGYLREALDIARQLGVNDLVASLENMRQDWRRAGDG